MVRGDLNSGNLISERDLTAVSETSSELPEIHALIFLDELAVQNNDHVSQSRLQLGVAVCLRLAKRQEMCAAARSRL